MFKIEIKNRVTNEITNKATFETGELANAWIAMQEAKGDFGNAFGKYYGARDLPKKGLGYPEEVDYNISLVESEFQKTISEAWTENIVDENGELTGNTIEHPAVIQTWVHLFPEYTSTIIDITTEYNEKQDEISKIEAGKEARAKCQRVLDYIAGYNLVNEFTLEQISTMQSVFSDVEAALKANRPTLALNAVNAATPDGTVVTDELKAKVISMLS